MNVMKFNFVTRAWTGYKASHELKEAAFQDISHKSSTCQKNDKLICISPIVSDESVCKGDSGMSESRIYTARYITLYNELELSHYRFQSIL